MIRLSRDPLIGLLMRIDDGNIAVSCRNPSESYSMIQIAVDRKYITVTNSEEYPNTYHYITTLTTLGKSYLEFSIL